MSLFDGFRKKQTEQANAKNKSVQDEKAGSADRSKNSSAEGYYFDSAMELAVYGKLFAKDHVVNWLAGDNYKVAYMKGYHLYEQGLYAQAIDACRKSLKLNPIGLSARFEICECYLKMGDLAAARKTLLEMKDYIVDNTSIAKFYRRIGFIEIEERRYQLAAACYQYSQRFENHPSVSQELVYIMSKAGVNIMSPNPDKILMSANVPLLPTIKFD